MSIYNWSLFNCNLFIWYCRGGPYDILNHISPLLLFLELPPPNQPHHLPKPSLKNMRTQDNNFNKPIIINTTRLFFLATLTHITYPHATKISCQHRAPPHPPSTLYQTINKMPSSYVMEVPTPFHNLELGNNAFLHQLAPWAHKDPTSALHIGQSPNLPPKKTQSQHIYLTPTTTNLTPPPPPKDASTP